MVPFALCAILWVANSQYERIRLCGAVLHALTVRKHTQPKGGQVFSSPATNKPWADIQMQWEIWNL
jgi:hypothetical protein